MSFEIFDETFLILEEKEQVSDRFKENAILNLNLAIKSIETKEFNMTIALLEQAKQFIHSSMSIRDINDAT